jgi:hypothetical protein
MIAHDPLLALHRHLSRRKVVTVSIEPWRIVPAEISPWSMRLKAATFFSTASSSPISITIVCTCPSARWACVSFSWERPAIVTSTPASFPSRAAAKPIPRLPPITTTCPPSSSSVSPCVCNGFNRPRSRHCRPGRPPRPWHLVTGSMGLWPRGLTHELDAIIPGIAEASDPAAGARGRGVRYGYCGRRFSWKAATPSVKWGLARTRSPSA